MLGKNKDETKPFSLFRVIMKITVSSTVVITLQRLSNGIALTWLVSQVGLVKKKWKEKIRAELNHYQVLMKTVIDFATLLKCSLKEENFTSHLRNKIGQENSSLQTKTGVRSSEAFYNVN